MIHLTFFILRFTVAMPIPSSFAISAVHTPSNSIILCHNNYIRFIKSTLCIICDIKNLSIHILMILCLKPNIILLS